MNVDLRRFDYALDPLLRLRGWQLDALRTQLGRLQHRIAAAQQEITAMRDELQQQGRHAAESLLARCDPAQHARSLHWLRQQRERIAVSSRQLADLQVERSELMERCRVQQQKLEAIEAHRDEAIVDFARADATLAAAAADRDWLARPKADGTHDGIADLGAPA